MTARPPITLIDGRSGAGKTTLARDRARAMGAQLLSLDDVYPGWDGLEAGEGHVLRSVLRPLAAGLPARWRRWDWARATPGDWVDVDPHRPLLIEGCGAISPEARHLADHALWIDAEDGERRRRALDRDGDAFAPHWERWARQEEWHARLHDPLAVADEVLRL